MVKIQEFMERNGIRNQTELATKLGLTQSAISSWNAGVRSHTYETCIDLLKMGMSIAELFGDDIASLVSYGNMTEDEFDSKVKASIIRIFSR